MSAATNVDLSKGLRQFRPPQPQTVSDELNTLVSEICRKYDLSHDQVFLTQQGEIWFDYEALCTLANALGEFMDISIEQDEINIEGQYVTAKAIIYFKNGESRRAFDTVIIGDPKPDGTTVQEMREAIALVRARALRAALRMANFDPVKRHTSSGQVFSHGVQNAWQKMNAEAHQHGMTLGWINKVIGLGSNQYDKSRWYKQLQFYFPNAKTSKDLSEAQMSRWVSMLRALVNAQPQKD